MIIRLKWDDLNTGVHTTEIYRTDTQPVGNPTGSPIATLTNNEKQWDDNTAVKGQTYWYTFKSIKGSNSAWSIPLAVLAMPNTGPGPQELLWGDLDLGAYGTIPEINFITTTRLWSMLNLQYSAQTQAVTWRKFVRRGKTLFVPDRAICYSIPWNVVYNKGMVFGVSGPGPQVPTGSSPTDQLNKVTIQNNDFIVRMPTGVDDRNNPNRLQPAEMLTNINNSGRYRKYSEVNDLIYSAINYYPSFRTFVMGNINGHTMLTAPTSLGLTTSTNGYQIHTQELLDNGAKDRQIKNTAIPNIASMDLGEPMLLSNGTGPMGFWPVLELVEFMEVVV